MPKFEFTGEEVKALNQLINIAVKAAGLEGGAAEAGVILAKKLACPLKEDSPNGKEDVPASSG